MLDFASSAHCSARFRYSCAVGIGETHACRTCRSLINLPGFRSVCARVKPLASKQKASSDGLAWGHLCDVGPRIVAVVTDSGHFAAGHMQCDKKRTIPGAETS